MINVARMASEELGNGRPPPAPSVNNNNNTAAPTQPDASTPNHLDKEEERVGDDSQSQHCETIHDEFQSFHTRPVQPRPPEQCALLCCFYAVFDIHAGPKIKHQSPKHFMEQTLPVGTMGDALLHQAFGTQSTTPVVSTRKTSSDNSAIETSTTEQPILGVVDTNTASSSSPLSIFKACSEYIIPSSDELTGNILNLSTHDIHLLTRPTIIHNQKYERNNLLFCVGFVLRRKEDPRPFRPVLSKLARVLRDMEVEHEFLSRNQDNNCHSNLLQTVLCSLNSSDKNYECNVVAGHSNVLNLKLYRPPHTQPIPLPDHAVPILLQRDWQHDWDLAIIWVSLHIDGSMNAKQISKVAEVDMEMVRACLRVLKHHGVIALIDMFFYSNRYELTNKSSELLSDKKIMDDAVSFVAKRRPRDTNKESGGGGVNYNSDSSPELGGMSPSTDLLLGHFQSQNLASTFDSTGQQVRRPLAASHHSSVAAQSTASDVPIADFAFLRSAITEFYLSCNRNHSVGQNWIELVGRTGPTNSMDWKRAFRMLDHRRLVAFGVVHGIIQRLHNYPMLVDNATHVALSLEAQALPKPVDMASPERSVSASPFVVVSTQQLYQAEKRKRTIQAANLLDGTHCDDQLVCELELPLEEIFSLLDGKKIVSVFAC